MHVTNPDMAHVHHVSEAANGWIGRWVAEVRRKTGGKEDEQEGVKVSRKV